MASNSDWRTNLGATVRYENIQRIQKRIETGGGLSQKSAFDEETEVYNQSESRDAYDEACKVLVREVQPALQGENELPNSPGISIGQYPSCHYIASGLVSEVYRSQAVALKVITETRNVEPHNSAREAKILKELSHAAIINLTETFRDQEKRLVLVFPFKPHTFANIIASDVVSGSLINSVFRDLFSALVYLHDRGIIHRDIKPSNILLASKTGPAVLSDFGTAWHPALSLADEPVDHKILEVGTTCYRAPETLFGNRAYGTSLDIWSAGAMLAECLRKPPKSLFESRDTSEDGNQLGLILSIFKTLGTPTKETWPEAVKFTTPPFEWYREFPRQSWKELLPVCGDSERNLVAKLVCYESTQRLTASETLKVLVDDISTP